MIAAYALALQAFFAYAVVTQAAAHGSATGSFFVICTSENGAASPDGSAAPKNPGTHCPICTLGSAPPAILGDETVLPLVPATVSHGLPFVSAAACISYHQARAGQTRAPPQNG